MVTILAILVVWAIVFQAAKLSGVVNKKCKEQELQEDLLRYRQYVIAWYEFQHLQKEILREGKRRSIDGLAYYQEEFKQLGKDMFGEYPAELAMSRASQQMSKDGYPTYDGAITLPDGRFDMRMAPQGNVDIPFQVPELTDWRRYFYEMQYLNRTEIVPYTDMMGADGKRDPNIERALRQYNETHYG